VAISVTALLFCKINTRTIYAELNIEEDKEDKLLHPEIFKNKE
jgi:hypothetical protein